MVQINFEPFLQVNESTFYVQDKDLEQMCAVYGQPARRFNTQLRDFFCSERCVRLSRMLSAAARAKQKIGEAILAMASPSTIGG